MIDHLKEDDGLLFFHLTDFSESYLQSPKTAVSGWGCAKTDVVSV